MLDKLEDFLYDVFGIILPGICVFLVFGGSWYFIAKDTSALIHFLDSIPNNDKIPFSALILLTLLFAYLLGTILMKFSRIFYEILEKIFDGFLNQRFSIYVPLDFKKKLIYKYIKDGLTFRCDEFSGSNTSIHKAVVAQIQKEYPNFPNSNFYLIYKISSLILSQAKIPNQISKFLAKYTFSKSLACLCFLTNLWLTILLYFYSKQIVAENALLLLGSFSVCGYIFHSNYKSFYRTCGDEALLSLYAYLFKNGSQ